MKLVAVSLAVLCGSFTLAAQAPSSGRGVATIEGSGSPNAKTALYLSAGAFSGCPVSMRLDQRLGGRLESVQDGKRIEDAATRLNLTLGALRDANRSRVKSARVTVRSYDLRQRFELIASDPASADAAPELVRTVDAHFVPAGDDSAAAELWLTNFGPVQWLNVDSIVYADGSVWEPAQGQSCRVTPNGFQLVSAH